MVIDHIIRGETDPDRIDLGMVEATDWLTATLSVHPLLAACILYALLYLGWAVAGHAHRMTLISSVINGLRDQIYRFREIILKDQKYARISHEDHMQMLKFMHKRDGEGVERLVREHILRGQEVVLADFGNK